MSRGFGRLQRQILDELEITDWFFVNDLLPEEHSHSQRTSLHRACRSLEKKYLVEAGIRPEFRWMWINRLGGEQIVTRWRRYPDPKHDYGYWSHNYFALAVGKVGKLPSWRDCAKQAMQDLRAYQRRFDEGKMISVELVT